jgi:hypothetical protein
VDDKVFIYLRLRLGETVLSRSKIREFGGLGSLLPQFLRQTVAKGVELPATFEGERPVLDYVDANTERVLISFHLDPTNRVQIVEGCIPPAYQGRMLDPEATSFSLRRFVVTAHEELTTADQDEITKRLAGSQIDLLEQIRQTMDDEGNFVVEVPL